MKRPLELVLGILSDASEPSSDRARGDYLGHAVEVRFVDRGAGSTRDPHTEVWFLGAAVRADLRLHVIPQRDEDVAEVVLGRGTDVIVGEADFDGAFFVEAAPEDVIVRLFNAPIRDTMKRIRSLAVHTHESGLRLERSGWISESEAIRDLVELGALIVDALPRAFEEADRAAQTRTGYRTTVTREDLAEARRGEATSVLSKKTERDNHRATRDGVLAVVIVIAVLIFALLVAVLTGGNGEPYP